MLIEKYFMSDTQYETTQYSICLLHRHKSDYTVWMRCPHPWGRGYQPMRMQNTEDTVGMKKAEMCKKQAEGRKIRIKIERKTVKSRISISRKTKGKQCG